jgi:hypothetical protein
MKKIYRCAAILLALCSAACAELDVPEGAAGGGADDVGDVAVLTEELGSWSKRYVTQTGGYQSLTAQWFVTSGETSGELCDRHVEVVSMPGANRLVVPPIPDSPGCEWLTDSYGAQGLVFVADAKLRKMWRLQADEGGTLWFQVATIPGTSIDRIRHDGTHVIWSDNMGVHKAPVGGGAVTTLLGGGHKLLDRDGSNLYVQRYNADDDDYSLLRQPIAGGAATKLRTMSSSYYGFAFNSTHIYFGQSSFDLHRIYKMAKPIGGISVFAEVDDDVASIYDLAANETHVYWVQDFKDARGNRLQRRKISDASDSSIHCKGDVWCSYLMLTPDNVFLVGQDAAENAVWRGQL